MTVWALLLVAQLVVVGAETAAAESTWVRFFTYKREIQNELQARPNICDH